MGFKIYYSPSLSTMIVVEVRKHTQTKQTTQQNESAATNQKPELFG